MRVSIPICAALCLVLTGCGWSPSPSFAPDGLDIDWPALEQLAITVFDVSCHEKDVETLQRLYVTNDQDVYVRSLPYHQRYLLLIDLNLGRQSVYFAGADIKHPEDIILGMFAPLVPDVELGVHLDTVLLESTNAAVDDLQTLLHADTRVAVVGYSSGGSLAAVVGAKLLHRGYVVEPLVTFGQPPVTDVSGAQSLADVPLLRVVAGRDWITMRYRGYDRHFGTALILMEGSDYAFLKMGGVFYTFASDPNVGRVDFFAHTNYLPHIQEKTRHARLCPYHLQLQPLSVHGVFPCDFTKARQ